MAKLLDKAVATLTAEEEASFASPWRKPIAASSPPMQR